jgi:hypothetical protein
MVSVPVRLALDVLAATLKPALPGPVAEAPLVTAIQATLLVALHAQPEPAATDVPPVPPAAVNDWLDVEML